MKALIDADILRYEIGFAAETGWKAITEGMEFYPPFHYVERLLLDRINTICEESGSNTYQLYLSEGKTFREDIAKTKPYKGNRQSNKPWHFTNLTVYMVNVLGAKVVQHIEADDALAIDHVESNGDTILCSRDKDLKQVPGMFYSWELGRQPRFGPTEIDEVGSIELSEDNKKIIGTGFSFFCSQLITGDVVDNIPGLPKKGPKFAYDRINMCNNHETYISEVIEQYFNSYGNGWEEHLLEQGQLLWMTRRLNKDGGPELWHLDLKG